MCHGNKLLFSFMVITGPGIDFFHLDELRGQLNAKLWLAYIHMSLNLLSSIYGQSGK